MSRLTGRSDTATTTAFAQPERVAATPSADAGDGTASGPGTASPRSRLDRRALLVAGALLGGVVTAVVLAGSLSDAITSRAAALEARQVNQAILERVEAGRREVDFAQTPAFMSFAARSIGFGNSREQAFALKPGGPPPPVIEPLGEEPVARPPADPLGSVLELLFER